MTEFPPLLTDQWASAYVQILFSVLFFAVGIPFLGLQLIIQEDVRHVVSYRQWKMYLWFLLVVMIFLAAISFIWLLHPAGPGQPPNRIEAAAEKLSINLDENKQAWLAALTVTFIPIATLSFGYWMPFRYSRRNVVGYFCGDLLRGYRRTGLLRKDILIKLVYLGERGNPGIEKNLVLETFKRIAKGVQGGPVRYKYRGARDFLAWVGRRWPGGLRAHRAGFFLRAYRRWVRRMPRVVKGHRYTGRQLEDLIRGLEPILQHQDKPGNDENYKAAAELLRDILRKASGNLPTHHDAILAASMMEKLGAFAVRGLSKETGHLYVMHTALLCGSGYTFRLGLEALQAKRFAIANDSLNRLETLALAEHGGVLERSKTTSNLLGLLAHYIDLGDAPKKRAYTFLVKARGAFNPSLGQCVQHAVDQHFRAANFETAEALVKAGLSGDDLSGIDPAALLRVN